jgi:hypothetical protein
MSQQTDVFGNPFDPIVGYARGGGIDISARVIR